MTIYLPGFVSLKLNNPILKRTPANPILTQLISGCPPSPNPPPPPPEGLFFAFFVDEDALDEVELGPFIFPADEAPSLSEAPLGKNLPNPLGALKKRLNHVEEDGDVEEREEEKEAEEPPFNGSR